MANPNALVLWEAQFGDFVNGAQSIIDEFISSGEAKWGQHSDVVLLLPHGLEGQGPDHSSGRIERFLQLCAEGSMTVALPSEPANYFHLLRRHALDGVSRPLVVFTPEVDAAQQGRGQPVVGLHRRPVPHGDRRPALPDDDGPAAGVRKLLLCSGKIYYELAAARDKRSIDDTAIVRIEQLYPVPDRKLAAVLDRYPERRGRPLGPGGAGQPGRLAVLRPRAAGEAARRLAGLKRVSRRRMAAPAPGSSKVHEVEQNSILDKAIS